MGDEPETAVSGSTENAGRAGPKARRAEARAAKKARGTTSSPTTATDLEDRPEPAGTSTQGHPSEVLEQLGGLLRAAHPRQALLTAVIVAVAAFVSGRPPREWLVAGAAVLVVQAILGLVNDAGDEQTDAAAGVDGNAVAQGHLPAGNATFAAICLAIIAIPLSLQNGYAAATALLGYLLAGLLSRTPLRRSVLSWLPWALSFALLPAFLSYGGWGAGLHGGPPTWQLCGAAALLGVGVHFLTSLPDLVADNKTGRRHLPLRIALRMGAPRLLVLAGLFTSLTALGVLAVAFTVGLRQ